MVPRSLAGTGRALMKGASMRASTLRHHGLNLLPELFGSPASAVPVPPLGWRRWLVLAALLVPPVLISLLLGYGVLYKLHVDHGSHALVEGFCALVSLVVFYVLHQEFISTGTCRLRMMAFAFLALGIVDAFHALSPPHSGLFVWFRGSAAFFGAALLALSLRQDGSRLTVSMFTRRNANKHAALVASVAVLFSLLSILFKEHLPAMIRGEHFSTAALIIKVVAGLLYFWVGRAFLQFYCRSRENILFVLAVAMLLLAESQLLAFFSDPWDVTWWIWHWIRTAVFIGILLGIVHEFVESARDLQASQRDLIESEKLASLGEMAASMAHEIRNPLGTLTSSVGLLKDDRLLGGERSELIEIVEKEVNRLNHIVSDTLAFAHSRADRMRMLDIEPVVVEAIKLLAASHPGIAVEMQFAPDLPLIRADEIQVQRIVWNIFENAAAAMQERGELRIAVRHEGDRIEISFQDSGPGIPTEIRGQLFKPFFSTKEVGTGLGLSIVQRMVLDHGGYVDIDNRDGTGACVRVQLPVAQRTV